MASKWTDFFKIFTLANEKDPWAKVNDIKNLTGSGFTSQDINSVLGGNGDVASLRSNTDMIDVTTLQHRGQRYKEYERLRGVPEIESVMTVLADEACVAGDTKIATPFGYQTIAELAKTKTEDFLVYCWDFNKEDFTLGWAFNPHFVKKSKTIKVVLENGETFTVTPDHRVMLQGKDGRNGTWIESGDLKFGDYVKAFYRIPANQNLTKLKKNQFPRIYTTSKGWINERQFTDEWRTGQEDEQYIRLNKVCRMLASGFTSTMVCNYVKRDWATIEGWLNRDGFTLKEIRSLAKNPEAHRVIGILDGPEIDVYDMSVREHKNFCTDNVIFHNCQKDNDGNVFKIITKNESVNNELQLMFFNRKMLNMNNDALIWFKNLCIFGDWFVETIIDISNPKKGIYRAACLQPENIYRIETNRGRVLEFQQSADGPNYDIVNTEINDFNFGNEYNQANRLIRFTPEQIVHFRIGDDRKSFYPYGQSLIEPARGPAHQLRMMEDAMVTYRLTRAPERRVYYIDVGQLPQFKAEAFVERLKDSFRKRKVSTNSSTGGANKVDEKWQPPSLDEDIFVPLRPNSQTRIDTLPGAENLGEIDDAIYFRNRLFTALNFPKNYFSNEDPGSTRITLSSQDVKFARMIERLQASFENGLFAIAERHLQLRGFPEEAYEDLKIKMTPPSEYRELSRQEVENSRVGLATQYKSANIMPDFDIYTRILKYSEEDTQKILGRLKIQKLEDLKLQVLAQNPAYLGIGIPGDDQSQPELGTEPGGPSTNPMEEMPGQTPPDQGMPPEQAPAQQPMEGTPEGIEIPDPSESDIKKYNLEILNYESEQDYEEPDYSVEP